VWFSKQLIKLILATSPKRLKPNTFQIFFKKMKTFLPYFNLNIFSDFQEIELRSLLPVLALDIEPKDKVLDMFTQSIDYGLIMLQTLYPGKF